MFLTPHQIAVIQSPLNARIFLAGPAGSGKTTAAQERLRALLESGIPGGNILLLTPQRTLQEPYLDLLARPERNAGSEVTAVTFGGLARRMVELFWPLAAEAAGFQHPEQPPVFLTLETAQYFMARLVRPLLEQGYFESVRIDRNRLYAQILDTLNKAALAGFPHTEIGARLDAAWVGEPAQRHVYADVQDCASRFRAYCLEHNLLDFSLQVEVFMQILWPHPLVRGYLTSSYRHLIYDNVEEDAPRAHDLIREWLPAFDSALLVYDEGGGYRVFLGADAGTARALSDLCDIHFVWDESLVVSAPVARLNNALAAVLLPQAKDLLLPVPADSKATFKADAPSVSPSVSSSVSPSVSSSVSPSVSPSVSSSVSPSVSSSVSPSVSSSVSSSVSPSVSPSVSSSVSPSVSPSPFTVLQARFYPELLEQVAAETRRLLDAGLPPSEVVIVSPYLSDALRFALMQRLETLGIPARSHRPSRSLRQEAASRALLTLAALAHPEWEIRPSRFDVAYALMQAIEGLDLVRAQLLTEITYRARAFTFSPFSAIQPAMRERMTYRLGERFDRLRDWLLFYREGERLPLDHFLRRLFGEVLSQPGFGFHRNFDSVRVAASLVESVRKFRLALQDVLPWPELGREYLLLLQEGVLAAQYLHGWSSAWEESVLVAPAYTFLMMNRPVSVQIWLDAGASGWYERLAQPLTHPYVLARGWPPGRVWTDVDEVQAGRESMARLVCGLLHRCREHLYLGITELGESGYEQRGELLRAFQRVLQANPQG